MAEQALNIELPPIPAKRYFTIGEVSELCGVKPHVLRYWEQEFTQLSPVKRRGNRRYYQHHEVLLIRRIRALLYDDGFTISGARNLLDAKGRLKSEKNKPVEGDAIDGASTATSSQDSGVDVQNLRAELAEISAILKVD
jgi:DNA-binding transcriptional MerR regulator